MCRETIDTPISNQFDVFLCRLERFLSGDFLHMVGRERSARIQTELIDLLFPYLEELSRFGWLGMFAALDSSYAARFYSLLNRTLTRVENRFGSLERLEPQTIQAIITLQNFVTYFQCRETADFRPLGERP